MRFNFPFLIVLFIPILWGCSKTKRAQPNIVVILSDDQAWGDLSLNGNKNISTPNIDKLASEGAVFSNFFVSPVCAPTRASFLTGREHRKTGVTGVDAGKDYLNLDEVTIADLLNSNGYKTGAFGKWHNGSVYPYHPNGRGFDEFYGFCNGVLANYFNTTIEYNGEEITANGYIADFLTDRAIDFINSNKDNPFFCYVPYNTPHYPLQVPDEYYDRVKQRGITMYNRDKEREISEGIESTIGELAMCENIDMNVGRILQTLKDNGLEENTIVIYFSDNGPMTTRWNGGMKGRKNTVSEGGIKVPFIIRYPEKIKPGIEVDQIAAHIDILPTIADYAGISTNSCKPLDGLDLKPLIEGNDKEWPDRMIFSINLKNDVSVRTQNYRLEPDGLFDMKSDPGQRKDILMFEPGVYGSLKNTLDKWCDAAIDANDSKLFLPVGYKEWPATKLLAQDCVFAGKEICFSAIWPNTAWITNWINPEDFFYWNIDVNTPGKYLVSVYYTCPESSIGSQILLDFDGNGVIGEIEEPFDPELIPSPDRVKRFGSYEKPFRELKLGEVELSQKKGKLTVKSIKMVGSQLPDIKMIKLTLSS